MKLKILKKIVTTLIAISVLLVIVVNILSAANKSFMGIRVFKVGSGSMEPYLLVNDLIVIREASDYKVDDVVTFREGGSFITHRIIEMTEDSVTTKGDANNAKDESITLDDIVGKLLFRSHLLGYLSTIVLHPVSIGIMFVFVFISYIRSVQIVKVDEEEEEKEKEMKRKAKLERKEMKRRMKEQQR